MQTTHRVTVDRAKPLAEQPHVGHNRWHPDIPPILRVAPNESVVLETLDAMDNQLTVSSTAVDVAASSGTRVHPLTGPIYVEGAEPGDILEVHIEKIESSTFGFTAQIPGFGFLRDVFPDPFLVKWRIAGEYAESPDLPGVRIKGAPFMGNIGVAPSPDLMHKIVKREQELLNLGGAVDPPNPSDAVPTDDRIAREGLRTVPPREVAGNLDIKQLTEGTTLFIPVAVPGALFSCGDAHFAQGDGESCGTAIEMQAVFHGSFSVRKGEATRGISSVSFSREGYSTSLEPDVPARYFATTGISVNADGRNASEDVTLAARNALLHMIDHLVTARGYSEQQAYAICSVAVDLRISEVVDVPNPIVSAFLPLDIFF